MKDVADKKFLKSFGKNLKRLRKMNGYSQESLAYEAEIELRQIGRIERGEINTGILSIKYLAEILKIDPQLFFDFKD